MRIHRAALVVALFGLAAAGCGEEVDGELEADLDEVAVTGAWQPMGLAQAGVCNPCKAQTDMPFTEEHEAEAEAAEHAEEEASRTRAP